MAKTKPLHMTRMGGFYLAWSAGRILQTLSAKSSALLFRQTVSGDLTEIAQTSSAQSSPARIDQTVSDASQDDCIVQAPSGQGSNLTTLAAYFPLPWSPYVRLLSLKTEVARSFYETEALRCGWSMRQLERPRWELEARWIARPRMEGEA